jgi:hypothetical protein
MPRCDFCGKLAITIYKDDNGTLLCKNCINYAYLKEKKDI